MGIGYIVGCLLSLIFWKFDRQKLFYKLNSYLAKVIKSKVILQVVYAFLIIAVCFLVEQIKSKELYNLITAFLIIDISNTEKNNLKQREKVRFYDSISTISRAVVCGFIAPLLFAAFFGNVFGIGYMLIYNISSSDERLDLLNFVFTVLTIAPSLIAEIFLYFVYLCRNKKSAIDFKGDYFINFFLRPLLNVDILGAYVESVNFYYLYSTKKTDYLKSYGEYTKKIDDVCIKDYLSIAYGICLIVFVLFFILLK
jgi:hypothetical protein